MYDDDNDDNDDDVIDDDIRICDVCIIAVPNKIQLIFACRFAWSSIQRKHGGHVPESVRR